jgi:tripartite-type tricarboxylate transporter receptor subunit TctC
VAQNLSRIALICGFALSCGAALAQSKPDPQSYPIRPVRIIVANTAGSGMDNVTRMLGQGLTEMWGQQVVVDNRPGAGGVIGHEIASKAPADGYTLLFGASAGAVIQPLMMKTPYDTARDFTSVSLVVTSIQLLASHPSLAATNVEELLAIARARPGQLNCGSSGSNSSNHLACEMLRVLGHVDFVHVPFKGTVPQQMGLVSGQVQFAFASIPTTMTQAKVGKIRVLAQGGPTRSRVLPDLPTIAETLPGFQAMTWYAIWAPRGTPQPIVSKLNGALGKILRDPALAQRLVREGLDPAPGTPAELDAYIRAESERFTKLIKLAGLATAH